MAICKRCLEPTSLCLFGVRVNPLTIDELNTAVTEAISRNERWIIAHSNMHALYLYHRDPKMRALFERARIVHIDGMPLIYWGWLLGYPVRRDQRVTYVDWVHPLMQESQRNRWRVFYLGGKPGVAAKAAGILRQHYPGLQIHTHHGYFQDSNVVLLEIARFQPHILMVGMGMPRQEHWILDNIDKIEANVILTAGACFDYVAGVIPTPPRWIGRIGLEWLYRLWSEPLRLAKRYLLEPWFLLPYMLQDISKRAKEQK